MPLRIYLARLANEAEKGTEALFIHILLLVSAMAEVVVVFLAVVVLYYNWKAEFPTPVRKKCEKNFPAVYHRIQLPWTGENTRIYHHDIFRIFQ